jgi:dTMP kinase
MTPDYAQFMASQIQAMDELTSYVHHHFRHPPTAEGSYWFSFEGIEGSGKSTQSQKLQEVLSKKNYTVCLFREPGGSELGEALRHLLLHQPRSTPWETLSELFLFLAARVQLFQQQIIPLLQKPRHIVLLDRSLLSSLAYQGIGRRLGLKSVLELHQQAPLSFIPHKTFLFSLSADLSLQRIHQRRQQSSSPLKDTFEEEKKDFFQALEEGYRLSSTLFSSTITEIDGSLPIEKIHQHLLTEIQLIISQDS